MRQIMVMALQASGLLTFLLTIAAAGFRLFDPEQGIES